jgi:hypothetical protein
VSLELVDWVIAFACVGVGAAVQGAVGFGLGLIAAPILLLIDPRFVPGPLMAGGLALTLAVAWRERSEIHLEGLRPALIGRFIGTAAAAMVLTVVSARMFELIFGVLVMLAIGLSLAGLRVSPTPTNAASAGFLSGFMGTLSSIGGPPMALLYQREGGAVLRATLSALFVLGSLVSLVALALVDRFGAPELALSAFITVPALFGFALSTRIRGLTDRAGVRPLVLALSFFSALAVLLRALG